MSYTPFRIVTSNRAGSITHYGVDDFKQLFQIFNGVFFSGIELRLSVPLVVQRKMHFYAAPSVPAETPLANELYFFVDPGDVKPKVKLPSGAIRQFAFLDDIPLSTTGGTPQYYHATFNNTFTGTMYHPISGTLTDESQAASQTAIDYAVTIKRIRARVQVNAKTTNVTVTLQRSGVDIAGATLTITAGSVAEFAITNLDVAAAVGDPLNWKIVTGSETGRPLSMVLYVQYQTASLEGGGGGTGITTINDLSDVENTGPAQNHILIYDATTSLYKNRGIVLGDLPGTLVDTGRTANFGDYDYIFRSSRFVLLNPAANFRATFVVPALTSNLALNLPSVTGGTHTLISRISTDTLQNKTASVDLNTINHSVTNAVGDLLVNNGTKFDRRARGTANQYLKVNAAGTDLEWGSVAIASRENNQITICMGLKDSMTSTESDYFFAKYMADTTLQESTVPITFDVDFSGYTKFRYVLHYTRDDSGTGDTHTFRCVNDTGGSTFPDQLINNTNQPNGYHSSVVATLPAWATGKKKLRLRGLASGTGNTATIHLFQLILIE